MNLATCGYKSQPGPRLQLCGFKGERLEYILLEFCHGSCCINFPGSLFVSLFLIKQEQEFSKRFVSSICLRDWCALSFVTFIFLSVHVWGHSGAPASMWTSEDNLQKSVVSYPVGHRDRNQAASLD